MKQWMRVKKLLYPEKEKYFGWTVKVRSPLPI
jgi:hypothetical protein